MVENGFWVFGYGSLIWQPEFTYSKKHIATLQGYARSFCMWSIHHRGTEDEPGLVLALDEHDQANCRGVAFFIEAEHAVKAIADLRERELVSSAYLEMFLPVVLDNGEKVEAVSYVVNRDHVQYCGGMPLEEQAQVISRAVGGRGPNTEYLYNTCTCLDGLGLADADLACLQTLVHDLTT